MKAITVCFLSLLFGGVLGSAGGVMVYYWIGLLTGLRQADEFLVFIAWVCAFLGMILGIVVAIAKGNKV